MIPEMRMKFLDKVIDNAVNMSKPVKDLADSVKTCAEHLKTLAETMTVIAYNQAAHHKLIMQMWSVQQTIFAKLQENSLDSKMPDINGKGDDKKTEKKPN